MGALAVALRMKGETPEEIAAAARALRERCQGVELGEVPALFDTCGTGGDAAGTFNISTVCALVVAACGVHVAKHGNRAVSSQSGSADVLEALGVRVEVEHDVFRQSIEQLGIGFLFAPAHHAALRHAAPVRRQLGLRTFFNLLGPLANPAGATHQLVGVYDPGRVHTMAQTLGLLGVQRAWVVHGEGGLDEVSTAGPTRVSVWRDGDVFDTSVEPADFGVDSVPLDALAGGDAACNAEIARRILQGERGGPRTAVLVNAAAALRVADVARDPREGVERAAEAIDSGRARETLSRWVRLTGR
jgi:anthranilate phosphoribosyltransferase